jgi:VWFA-related protein
VRNATLLAAIAVACGALGLAAPKGPLSADEQATAINAVREYALSYTRNLPNYTCIQATRQTMTAPAAVLGGPPGFPLRMDRIEEQLSFVNRREIRTLTKINDSVPSAKEKAKIRTMSSGEFGNLLDTIFEPQTHADIRWDHVTTLDRRRVYVFAFHVPQAKGYALVEPSGQQIRVPFDGFVYADSKTGTVVRIEMNCSRIPARSEYRTLRLELDYQATKIAGREYVLPSHSYLRYEMTEGGATIAAEYKSYRRFSTDSTIEFARAETQPQAVSAEDDAVAGNIAANRAAAAPEPPAAEPIPDPGPPAITAPAEVALPELPKPETVAAPPNPVFQTATRLVQVSVIAQDKDGKPVTDLRRDEFQIFDNGAPQEIRLFLADHPDLSRPAPNAPGTFTNRIASGGASVLLFDKLFIDRDNNVFEHNVRARQKALQALKAIPPGDRIAIYALWCHFQVVRELTTDRNSLLEKLNSFAPQPAPCSDPVIPETQPAPFIAPQAAASIVTMKGHEMEGFNEIAARQQARAGEDEFRVMADHLAGIPGRKNLIWVTSTFRLSPANVQRLIDANVAIYPVDAVGSMIGTPSAKKDRYAPLMAFAAMTGGAAFYDRDDFDAGIREALADGRVSYTLGFYPSAEDANTAVHRLGVSVRRPAVTLRYRTSYELKPQPPTSANPVDDLVQAMNRPVDATTIPLTASATRVQDRLDLEATLDLPSLDLNLSQGLWKGQVEVVARFLAADGSWVGDVAPETVTLNLRQTTYESMLQSGLPYRKELRIPAKAVELRLLVGNLVSSKIGTLTIPLSEVKEK